jgi:hypothetical protein
VLASASLFRTTAIDWRCACRGRASNGICPCLICGDRAPFSDCSDIFRGFRAATSLGSADPCRTFLDGSCCEPDVEGVLCTRGAATGFSAGSGSTGRGRRACATARGPAYHARAGTAMLASTKLDRTVTGRTLSRMRSLLTCSPPPKTIL